MKKLLVCLVILTFLVACLGIAASAAPVDVTGKALITSHGAGTFSTSGRYPISNIKDGDIATNTYLSSTGIRANQQFTGVDNAIGWLKFDYMGPVKFSSITITWNQSAANVASDYFIMTSTDGTTWTKQSTITGNTERIRETVFTTPVTANLIAIVITKPAQSATEYNVRVNEVQIMGEIEKTARCNVALLGATATTSGTPSASTTTPSSNTPITRLIDGCVSSGNGEQCYITGTSATDPLAVQPFSDGDATTTEGFETDIKDYVKLDLGESYMIDEVRAYLSNSIYTCTKDFYILTSVDGAVWTERIHYMNNQIFFVHEAAGTSAPVIYNFSTPVEARYVALAAVTQSYLANSSTPDKTMRIGEIAVGGTRIHRAPEDLVWTAKIASWKSVATADSYSVQLFKDGVAEGAIIENLTETSYDFSTAIGIIPGTYTFKVWAVQSGNATSASPNATLTAAPLVINPDALDAPTNLKLVGTVAKWSGVTGATSYKLQLFENGVAVGTEVQTNGLSYDFAALMQSGKTYTFTVKALSLSGLSPAATLATPATYTTGTANQNLIIFLPLYMKYTVTYHANDGVVKNIKVTAGDRLNTKLTIAENTFTNGTKTFVEWNTKQDGKGTSYAPGDKLLMNQSFHLFAIWK